MATQTERLRAALERQGFVVTPTKSSRTCMSGTRANGAPAYLFLDKTGGARYNTEPRIGGAIPLSSKSIALLLAGEPSKFFGPVKGG